MRRFGYAALAALAATGCGAQDYAADTSDAGYGSYQDAGASSPECFSSNECPTGWTCSEFGDCVPPPNPPDPTAPDAAPPPEVEYELSPPSSSLRYVYVAMTELDALAKIDGETLAVASIAVGDRPEVVATAPHSDTAVVLDAENATATIVRPTIDRDDKVTVATLPRLNTIQVDPTGRYAVAYFDLTKAAADAGGLDFVGEIGSFQDVTVIDLEVGEERAVDLTVGFRPREIEFDAAGTRAFVVTDDGVSVIDLAEATTAGPSIVAPIPVTADPLVDPMAIEVDVVAGGEHAVVREAGVASIRIVRLTGAAAGQSWVVPLPAPPSDVDLSPDGSRAYATLREASALAVIDVPGDGLAPGAIDVVSIGDEVVGSLVLSPDGARGILFTNAVLAERLTVIELDEPGFPHVTRPLQKSVRLVEFDASGDKAIVTHAKAFGDPDGAATFDEFIDRSYGYSVFDVATGFPKLQVTPVDPGAFAFAPEAPLAYLILDGGDAETAVRRVHVIELDTGVVREIDLGSAPEAVGILPGAGVAFVSQRHPLGRMSFVDLATGAMRTVTGFDLNSRIID